MISAEDKIELLNIELRGLFEIIDAINNNEKEESLYRIFRFTLKSQFYNIISAMALYTFTEEGWRCQEFYGLPYRFSEIPLPDVLKNLTFVEHQSELIEEVRDIFPFNEFDSLIPIAHKSQPLAFIFLKKKSSVQNEELFDKKFISALCNIIIVAIENKKFVRREQRQRHQIELAKNVQRLFFPKKLPYSHELKIAANYQPHSSVGGDYYDYIPLGKDRFIICIADVSGKGISASLLMSNFRGAVHMLTRYTDNLSTIVQQLNDLVYQVASKDFVESHFVTAFFLHYDFAFKRIQYINAGHNAPFLIDKEGKVVQLEPDTTVLGAVEELPNLRINEIENMTHWTIVCFTDGITETTNFAQEQFGDEQLKQFLQKNFHLEPLQMNEKLLEELAKFRGSESTADDITLLTCQIKAS
ncbi:MAG: PP2C family protein-serine/threonine phosphatase [Cytophagales bacterium]|nr:PP2C family protein-serine/threonine phosphatase [Cytophagales bacterium]MDW8384205.1 PP2C family protein-serine/threonine phosphatase [Flammeovirgaceae bacterium]